MKIKTQEHAKKIKLTIEQKIDNTKSMLNYFNKMLNNEKPTETQQQVITEYQKKLATQLKRLANKQKQQTKSICGDAVKC